MIKTCFNYKYITSLKNLVKIKSELRKNVTVINEDGLQSKQEANQKNQQKIYYHTLKLYKNMLSVKKNTHLKRGENICHEKNI